MQRRIRRLATLVDAGHEHERHAQALERLGYLVPHEIRQQDVQDGEGRLLLPRQIQRGPAARRRLDQVPGFLEGG